MRMTLSRMFARSVVYPSCCLVVCALASSCTAAVPRAASREVSPSPLMQNSPQATPLVPERKESFVPLPPPQRINVYDCLDAAESRRASPLVYPVPTTNGRVFTWEGGCEYILNDFLDDRLPASPDLLPSEIDVVVRILQLDIWRTVDTRYTYDGPSIVDGPSARAGAILIRSPIGVLRLKQLLEYERSDLRWLAAEAVIHNTSHIRDRPPPLFIDDELLRLSELAFLERLNCETADKEFLMRCGETLYLRDHWKVFLESFLRLQACDDPEKANEAGYWLNEVAIRIPDADWPEVENRFPPKAAEYRKWLKQALDARSDAEKQ